MNIEENLIKAGVKNLKIFGYPKCNEENIFTDRIYSNLFKQMLEENKGKSKEIDEAIKNLLIEL
jgi:hypothetical protein